MPFDGSGNFSRSFNWQQDRDDGIKILASRMDGEFDNFANGMNVVFFRNGLVPMTGNLSMGQNYITGIGAGSVGALGIRFADDSNTGLYLNGIGKLGLVSGGVQRAEVNSAGMSVTGVLGVTGSASVTGGASFGGEIFAQNYKVDTYAYLTLASGNPILNFDDNDYIKYDRANNNYQHLIAGGIKFQVFSTGTRAFGTFQADGASTFLSTVDVSGALRQAGNQVWHVGNFNPASYALLANPNFTGNISVGGNTNTVGTTFFNNDSQFYALKVTGDPVINFDATDYMQYDRTGNLLTFRIGGTVQASIDSLGFVRAASGMTIAGNTVYHAGNFNPDSYAALSGATFGGNVNAPTFQVATNKYLATTGGNLLINGDVNDYYVYDAANNSHNFLVGGSLVFFARADGVFAGSGAELGYRDIPQNVISSAFTFNNTYRGRHVYYNGGAATGFIPTDAQDAGFGAGSTVVVINDGSGVLTLAPNAGATLVWATTGGTGNRSLAVGGMATLVKVAGNRWFVSGAGLS